MYIFEALKVVQNGVNLYIFSVESGFIYKMFDVSRRIEDKEEGYQRSFSTKKINDIKRYIKQEN